MGNHDNRDLSEQILAQPSRAEWNNKDTNITKRSFSSEFICGNLHPSKEFQWEVINAGEVPRERRPDAWVVAVCSYAHLSQSRFLVQPTWPEKLYILFVAPSIVTLAAETVDKDDIYNGFAVLRAVHMS